MRVGTKDDATEEAVPGDEMIGELVSSGVALIPFAIDPHGRFGPLLENFLFHCVPRRHLTFPASRPNAAQMYQRITDWPCPLGIVGTAHDLA